MSQQVLKLNCNGRKRRNVLRLLGITYPLWGLVCAGVMLSFCSNPYLSQRWLECLCQLASPVAFFAGYLLSFNLLKNKLIVSDEQIKFPGLAGRSYGLQELSELYIDDGAVFFCFGKATRERISLKRMGKENASRLLAFIYKHAANCKVDENAAQAIEQFESCPEFDKSAEQLQIAYNGQFRITTSIDVCKQYEKYFWISWLTICVPMAIFLLPLLLYAPFELLCKGLFPGFTTPELVNMAISAWGSFWYETLYAKLLLETTNNFATRWHSILSQFPVLSLFLIASTSVALVIGLRALVKPTALILNRKGFTIESVPALGIILDLRHFPWHECKGITLRSNEKKMAEDKLEFYGLGGKLAELDLRGLGGIPQRKLIKQAIEFYAPHVDIDPRFLESISRAQNQSYTELWLESLNCPPKRDRLTPLQKGDSLQSGQYQIVETIGAGGQGVAYLAREKGTNSDASVVVKEFMLPVYVDRRARQMALERFESEAKTLRGISHPNIVELKGHFIEDHRAYLVLEHINGKSLRKLFSANPVKDQMQMERLLRQMCQILEYLHELEPPMVHRDFTPDNLILDESGVLKLIDFNVARHEGAKTKMTVVGKHAYMPPEQFAGKPVCQSDLYALGASLYYCLTGEDPEPFTQSELPAGAAASTWSPIWQQIVHACTALSAAKRIKSSTQILEMLSADGANSDAGVRVAVSARDEVLS